MSSRATSSPAPREPTPNAEAAPARRRSPARAAALPRGKGSAPAPARPKVLSSFLVDLVDVTPPAATAAESTEVTARIRRVDDAVAALGERGFKLSNSVLDAVSGLLVDLVREDDGDAS